MVPGRFMDFLGLTKENGPVTSMESWVDVTGPLSKNR